MNKMGEGGGGVQRGRGRNQQGQQRLEGGFDHLKKVHKEAPATNTLPANSIELTRQLLSERVVCEFASEFEDKFVWRGGGDG
jgi:hypothetical protein